MSVITLLLIIIVVGVLVWLATTYIPMDPRFKTMLVVVAIIIVLLIILRAFGIFDMDLGTVPKVHR
jgi:hypothetical protein